MVERASAPRTAIEFLPALQEKLQRIFRATPEHTIALFDGTGTMAIECAIGSVVPPGGKILVVDNGAQGERIHALALHYGMDIVHLRYAWGDLVAAKDIVHALERHPDIGVVAMAHHERSVGLLNPISEVGALCRQFDVLFVVDAESSVGAEDIDVERDHIDVCTGSADAGLPALGGIAIACVSPRVWPRIETGRGRSYSLDLDRHRPREGKSAEQPAIVLSTLGNPAYRALDAACTELLGEGLERRLARYRRRDQRLRQGLSGLGLAPFTRTGRESHSVVICCVPAGMTCVELCRALAERGYVVAPCSNVLAENFVQITHPGHVTDSEIDAFLAALGQVVASARRQARLATQPVTASSPASVSAA